MGTSVIEVSAIEFIANEIVKNSIPKLWTENQVYGFGKCIGHFDTIKLASYWIRYLK